MSWPPRLKAWWQVNFGPKGTYYDDFFRDRPLREELRVWGTAIPAAIVANVALFWLRAQGVSGLNQWLLVVSGAVLVAFVGGTVVRILRRLAGRGRQRDEPR